MAGLTHIPAIILAGGKGTRLRSVVADRPKPLAEVLGRPYITYLLDQLVDAGCRHAVISTGYKAAMIEEALGGDYRSLRLSYAQEAEPLGTGGGIRLAMEQAEGDIFIALNGDSYCSTDLNLYTEWFFKANRTASLLLVGVDDTTRYGRVEIDGSEQVSCFAEKGKSTGPGLINAGIYLLKRSALEGIPAGSVFSMERVVFPDLVGAGLYGYAVEAPFLDIGTPESYAAAEIFFSEFQGK